LLVAAGRRPETEGLGLENAGVATDRGAIEVGPDMRTSVDHIYAIGDVIGPPMLAHAAFHEADVAVDNIFEGGRRVDYRKIAYCVYSYPEVGSVGLTEEQARDAYPDCKITRFPFVANGKAMVCGETEGMVKIIFEDTLGELLGAHIIGEHATELIANFATAVSSELTIDEIAATVMAHPTLSEAMAEAAQAGVGHALHI
jgi:dihydrolipoamide dehydrogenase